MSTPSTIGVDNDLSASEASVTLRTANDEQSRWLNLLKVLNSDQSERGALLHLP